MTKILTRTNPTSVTRYIISKPGDLFDLQVDTGNAAFMDCTGLACYYFVDGVKIDCFYRKLGENQSTYLTGPSVCVNGNWSTQQLKFADLHTTDEDGSTGQSAVQKRMKALGQISLRVWRVANIGSISSEMISTYKGGLSNVTSVPEKALKGQAIDTSVEIGEAKPSAGRHWAPCDWVDCRKGLPYLTFIFMYRSRKALQSMCIIPRSPSAVPLEERAMESLSREELLELLSRRKQQSDVMPVKIETKHREHRSKRERDEEVDNILASARSAKIPRVGDIEMVDLLDD